MWDSVIENTESICPDKICQAANEKEMRKLKNKRLELEKRKRESVRNRKKVAHNLMLKK